MAGSPVPVGQSWQAHFRQQLAPLVREEHARLKALAPKGVGRPKQTVVTGYLIFDDSVHEKPKGRKMGGLGTHYSNTAQKVVAGHCLFSGLYVLLGQRCPLAARMYCQQRTCEQENQPFQSKIEMAVEEIEQFEPVATAAKCVVLPRSGDGKSAVRLKVIVGCVALSQMAAASGSNSLTMLLDSAETSGVRSCGPTKRVNSGSTPTSLPLGFAN